MKGKWIFWTCLMIMTITAQAQKYIAGPRWISAGAAGANQPNTWIAFRQDIHLDEQPAHAETMVAVDSKYWLWINGALVIFEGGLKRGPNPAGTYYDQIDLAPYLRKGDNKIAVLLWYFGKDGFSHKSSGKAGLLFQLQTGTRQLISDKNWLCRIHPAYGRTGKPEANYRLSESNVAFDARKDTEGWQELPLKNLKGFKPALELGGNGSAPWNRLVRRPIPEWKDFGIEKCHFERHTGKRKDTVIAELPYNMQMTPIIKVNDPLGGASIEIRTDHSEAGGAHNLRAAYITRKGRQSYESYGWLNGEKIILILPPRVKVYAVKYRETGYAAEPEGRFYSSDPFYNLFWKKAERTLYVNMRDNFFDCPDRERAQWWGDVVLLMGECFYTYSVSTHALMSKAIHQLVDWQKPDSVLYSPIPGIYNTELADQMLASIGQYGFWNYFMNTADTATIAYAYPAVRKYLALWKTDQNGLTVLRKGGWLWGDWGNNKDIRLIQAGWHYLALKGAAQMAGILGYTADSIAYRKIMDKLKAGFNTCWNGSSYRAPDYKDSTDDRVQALAVLSGVADAGKYPALLQVFKTELHASPYMEKYVMEALFKMGYGTYALERTRKRFSEMVTDPRYTTLFEGWGVGKNGFGGGTTNHGWSGGPQIVIAQYLCGITPLEAGYQTFLVEPEPASFSAAYISVPTVKGKIFSGFKVKDDRFSLHLRVPEGSKAIVRLPEDALGTRGIRINGAPLSPGQMQVRKEWQKEKYISFQLEAGYYKIRQQKNAERQIKINYHINSL